MPWDTRVFWWGLLLLWPLYLLELAAHAVAGSQNLRFNLLYLFVPPLRLGGRDHSSWRCIWLPRAGWRHVDRSLFAHVEKALSGPMVGFALLVLPVLAIEFGLPDLDERRPRLKLAVETASSVIWLAFALELIVMASIARRKARFLTKHWIDLLIVLLPMAQALPALRLTRLSRLKYLGKLTRVYRTRGITSRTLRALLLLDFVQRLLHLSAERQLEGLREKMQDHYHEIEQIRGQIRELEARLAAEQRSEAQAETIAAECRPVGE
jgi:hypothetical protein